MRVIILAVLTVFSLNCSAEDYLRLSGVSWHSTPNNNPINYGAGLELGINDRWSYIGGYYRNSEYHSSWYAGARYAFYKEGDWNLGIAAGAVTGYNAMTVMPMVMPDLCWKVVCGMALPKVSKDGSNVIAINFRLPIE